jgi:hypothetical protein
MIETDRVFANDPDVTQLREWIHDLCRREGIDVREDALPQLRNGSAVRQSRYVTIAPMFPTPPRCPRASRWFPAHERPAPPRRWHPAGGVRSHDGPQLADARGLGIGHGAHSAEPGGPFNQTELAGAFRARIVPGLLARARGAPISGRV